MNKVKRYLRDHMLEKLAVDMRFLRARFFLYFFNLIPDLYTLSPFRNLFLKWGGASISIMNAYVRSPFWCCDLRQVQLGRGVFINMGCRIEGAAPVVIGNHCQIGPFCCFENVNHTEAGDQALPVLVGTGVWVGARAVLTPGTVIGDCSVIAAGAVVTKKVPAGELWGGVPARKIKNTAPVQ
ncbi:acyltransferase [Geomonas subterranea]|uniref:acyltransferase n=1 Tax=Geomonas subterranea TaxID=2847989 RepID=UPI00384E1710